MKQEVNVKLIKLFITLMVLVMITTLLPAQQLKIGYVQADRIRTEYEEFQEAERELQLEFSKVQFEYQTMTQRLDSLKVIFDTQRFMSTPDWKREKEQEISSLEQQVQNFQIRKVGPEGELYKKQLQLENEIIIKVQQAVSKVAIDKGYDYILDSIALLYGKPTHNLTDDVLHELRNLSGDEGN